MLWFHGAPSCRLEARLFESWASSNGVCVIAPDRPGMGQSSRSPGASVLDWASDVVVILDHLGLERVSVMGGSGGGPYVLAVAHALPERVVDAVILASGGVDPDGPAASGWVDRAAGLLAHRLPGVLSLYFRLMGLSSRIPAAWLRGLMHCVPGTEARVLREPGVAELASPVLGEAFVHGVAGAVDDYRRLGGRWGFRVRAVACPVLVVQGLQDPFVPVRQAKHFARSLPSSRLELVEGAGHIGVIRDWGRVSACLGWPR